MKKVYEVLENAGIDNFGPLRTALRRAVRRELKERRDSIQSLMAIFTIWLTQEPRTLQEILDQLNIVRQEIDAIISSSEM